jgi:hypothetical protein
MPGIAATMIMTSRGQHLTTADTATDDIQRESADDTHDNSDAQTMYERRSSGGLHSQARQNAAHLVHHPHPGA